MSPTPPSFASRSYWDARFTKDPANFEWLQEPEVLRNVLEEAINDAPCLREAPLTSHPGGTAGSSPLQATSPPSPRILHIGCGTSDFALFLRELVPDPARIHNTDFSSVAIDLGQLREREVLERAAMAQPPQSRTDPDDEPPSAIAKHRQQTATQWSTLDLLSLPAMLALTSADGDPGYDIVVDKSTSDAIACGRDIRTHLPYPIRAEPAPAPIQDAASPVSPPRDPHHAAIHPLHVLALHLALATRAGGRWIALSYSPQRFPFLPPVPARASDGRLSRWMEAAGFVHPGKCWELERRVEWDLPVAMAGGETAARVSHTLYVLRRTEVRLRVDGLGVGEGGS